MTARTPFENETSSLCSHFSIIPRYLACKIHAKHPGTKFVEWFGDKWETLKMSSSAHVIHTSSKQVISCRGKNENDCEMYKIKTLHVQSVQKYFFIVKYANLRRSSRLRHHGFFSVFM